MSSELLIQALMVFAGAAGAYAAIKADLTRAIVLSEQAAQKAETLRERIDHHIENCHMGTR